MATNTLLTVDKITREALRILHEKLSFVGTINRQYDDQFAKSGAKIGTALRIRKPNQYTVRTGATMSAQDTTETQETLTVATQKGVDMEFSSTELTMSLDDFSSRILEPAMAVLASNIESDVLQNTTYDVYQMVDGFSATVDFENVLEARAALNRSLAPKDGNRCIQMESGSMVSIVNELKGLFHDENAITKQYREGMMGRTGGFDWYENERVLTVTNGNDVTGVAIDDAGAAIASGDSTITVDGLTATTGDIHKGQIFTIASVNKVHPETKADMGVAQEFVATADATADGTGDATVSISPTLYSTGALQNITALPADNAALTFKGAADTSYVQNLAYHKDFATFATADLVMPDGVDFASRQVYDGISLRIVRDYTISTDQFPCRIDVLYGYKTLYPQLACRIYTP